ncbi:IS3 family transposase [Parafannyhessea umbonata]|uniref:IS3 family transposase n=1 Tax=Parafannyhessea umbonata TaxID=604330 RepID=UPI0034C685E5
MRSPDRNAETREMVCAVFDANDGTYGRRRIHDELRAQGHVVGERRIRRIMAEEGPGRAGRRSRRGATAPTRRRSRSIPATRPSRTSRRGLPTSRGSPT